MNKIIFCAEGVPAGQWILGIIDPFPVHFEFILIASWIQENGFFPPSIRSLFHESWLGVPVVEIPEQENLPRIVRLEFEGDFFSFRFHGAHSYNQG